MQAIQVRKELTDEWQGRGVKKGIEYAILTDEITRAWSGMSTRQYKQLKGLKKENLRDHMSTTEIILNMLAETATKVYPGRLNQRTSKKISRWPVVAAELPAMPAGNWSRRPVNPS